MSRRPTAPDASADAPRSGHGAASALARLLAQPLVAPSELLVATAESADAALGQRVPQLLATIKQSLQMDVVFVSEFIHGERVFRHVDVPPDNPVLCVGAADPLEASWCARVVDGRLPQLMPDAAPYIADGRAPAPGIPIGTHLSVPIVLRDGRVYGTLCCFSFAVAEAATQRELALLQAAAERLAEALAATGRAH